MKIVRLVAAHLAVVLAGTLVAACGGDAPPPIVRRLDRPADITFGCIVTTQEDGGVGTAAAPLSDCGQYSPATPDGGPPMLDGGTGTANQFAFIVESARGTVAVAGLGDLAAIRDSDPLIPGHNGLPVGELPVGIATTPDGCFAVTANQGSCDLGRIDIYGAAALRAGVATAIPVRASGGILAARPAAITTPPPQAAGARCADPPTPQGLAYVALPGCHLVAAVDVATGNLVAGVRLPEGGPPELVGSDVACPLECAELAGGAAVAPDGPGLEPIALSLEPDGTRLYVGATDAPALVVVELDAAGLPTATETVPLEGAIGLRRIAASGPILMGNEGEGGIFHFVYGIALDATIHVVDVTPGRAARECDTQLDPRYLRDVTSVAELACLQRSDTRPRRGDATGPGLRLPFGAVPRDVAFLHNAAAGAPSAGLLNGSFAVITAESPIAGGAGSEDVPRGVAYYVNVNDRNYPDFEDPANPALVDLTIGLPHSLRDRATDRLPSVAGCRDLEQPNPANGPPRIFGEPVVSTGLPEGLTFNALGGEGDRLLPMIHRTICRHTPEGGQETVVPVWELAQAAPVAEREVTFADLPRIHNETWLVSWEGPLAIDPSVSRRAGGEVTAGPTTLTMRDDAGLFCDLGVETWDSVTFLGCLTDNDCGLGEVCYVHPEAPQGVTGLCFQAGREAELGALCKGVLTTVRRYSAAEVGRAEVTLVSRPVVLPWTPVDGCTDAAQCTAIAEDLATFEEERRQLPAGTLPRHTWGCVNDPAFEGVTKCVMECDNSPGACAPGSVCQAGRCVEGPIPPAECLAAVQRYEVTAGYEYTVLGSRTGYRHQRVVDPATDLCVDDPTASPLLVGRFGLHEPLCAGDELTALVPNPCRLTVEEPVAREGEPVTTRPADAVRFRTLGVTFTFTDVTIPLPDQPGERYTPVPAGYRFRFDIAGGGTPLDILLDAALPDRIRRAPDGTLWIVDMGDSASAGRRGQVIHLLPDGISPVRLD